jgi:hypothetical protein
LLSANTVLTSFLNFVGGDTTAILHVVLNLAHAQIEQIVATYFLAIGFVIGINGAAVIGFVFVFDVVATLRPRQHGQQQGYSHTNFCDFFHEHTPINVNITKY